MTHSVYIIKSLGLLTVKELAHAIEKILLSYTSLYH